MALNKGKHIVDEIGGVRCTIVETGASKERVAFLTDLLTLNKLEVKSEEEKRTAEDAPVTYKIGVTDIIFNPVIAVYQRRLLTPKGQKVTPAYWEQKTDECDPNYWNFDHKQQEDGNYISRYRTF
jgi:hypothetical protein